MLDQRDLIFFDTYNVRWRYIYAFMCRQIKMKRKREDPLVIVCALSNARSNYVNVIFTFIVRHEFFK